MTSHTAAAQVELRVQELLATPQGRARTAVYLAEVEVHDYRMGDYVTGMLPRLAPQWDEFPEERNARFEALQDAVRTGVSVFVDDAVDALLNGQPSVLPGVELPDRETDPTADEPSSTRRPRLAIEAAHRGDK
jgi:hypothetical protein